MIDGLNLQHRKLQDNQGFFGSLMAGGILKGSKSKQKPISSIAYVKRFHTTNNSEFLIVYREDDKQVKYRALNPDDCSHIIAKLRFLLQGQNLTKAGRRGGPPGTF